MSAVDFDIDSVIDDAVLACTATSPPERARHRAALDRARLDAARFLLQRGSAADRQLAARFAFRAAKRAS